MWASRHNRNLSKTRGGLTYTGKEWEVGESQLKWCLTDDDVSILFPRRGREYR